MRHLKFARIQPKSKVFLQFQITLLMTDAPVWRVIQVP